MEKANRRIDRFPSPLPIFPLAASLIFCILLGHSIQGADRFVRGRITGQGDLGLTDAIDILGYLFLDGPGIECLDAADANDDGSIDISDAVRLLMFLFAQGDPVPDPFPDCGTDPTPDSLGCRSYPACPQDLPTRVLFIGNSFTSTNDLPGRVGAVTESVLGPGVMTTEMDVGGVRLIDHATAAGTLNAIRRGGWTHVVLQGQSMEPIEDLPGFLDGAARLAAEIRAVGSEVVFFETWAYRGDPGAMQAGLRSGYEEAVKTSGGVIAPVGDAWAASLSVHPEIVLHAPDGGHPSEAGTYLAACVFFAVLTGGDPVAARGAPPGLGDAEAAALREIARQTVLHL
jgi:hypothetical protein